MKKGFKLWTAVCLCAALVGCSDDIETQVEKETPNNEETPTEVSPATLEISPEGLITLEHTNGVGFNLLTELTENNAENTNVCISPLSLMQLFASLANGALV